MKALPAILALLVVSTTVPASAEHEQLSVGNLQEICTRSDNGGKEACRYYILGVTEGTRMAAAFAGDKTHFCIPDGVSLVAVESLIKNEESQRPLSWPWSHPCRARYRNACARSASRRRARAQCPLRECRRRPSSRLAAAAGQ